MVQPSWPTQPPPLPPQQPSGSGRTVVLAVAAAAAAVVAIGVVGLGVHLAARSSSSSPPATDTGVAGLEDPEQVVTDYLNAADEGDCGQATALLADAHLRDRGETREEARSSCERVRNLPENDGISLTVDSTRLVVEEEDTAVVEVRFTMTPAGGVGAVTQNADYVLRREGQGWRIYDLGASGVAGS
jgi:hypothetical protein